MIYFSHRGANTKRVQNTVEAFALAHAQGATHYELDVHLLKDGALAVHHDYQGLGIGKTLVEKCMACYPRSEWLAETENAQGFYEKIGFQKNQNHFLHIPCPLFPTREGK